ncbi:MAG: hypothetical protein ACI9BW_004150 [Gammaproteobacteria bacterium]|jgi:hypothetical protein
MLGLLRARTHVKSAQVSAIARNGAGSQLRLPLSTGLFVPARGGIAAFDPVSTPRIGF